VDEDMALEKVVPSEVTNCEAVMGFQLGPEYQFGE